MNTAKIDRLAFIVLVCALGCSDASEDAPDYVADAGVDAGAPEDVQQDTASIPDTTPGGDVDAAVEEDTTQGQVEPVSSEATYEFSVTEGVVYGQGLRRPAPDAPGGRPMDLVLDVYEPEGQSAAPRPMLVAVHGGGFATGSRRERTLVDVCEFFASRGWITFSVDYRVAGQNGNIPETWPARPDDVVYDELQWPALYPAARDVKAAMRWVHTHAGDYNGHPDYITVLGGSAGGMLAVMVGFSDPADYRDEIDVADDPTLMTTNLAARADVRTVIEFWGSQGLLDALTLQDGNNRFDAADPPVLIAHGRSDPTVGFALGEQFQSSCESAGIDHEFHPFDGGHGAWNITIDGSSLPELALDFIVRKQALPAR